MANCKHTKVWFIEDGSRAPCSIMLLFYCWLRKHKLIILFLALSVGRGQCPGRPGKAHTNLWGLQCQPKSPSARQLVGYSLPVPPLGSTGVCHITFLSAWLRQPTIAVTHLPRNTYPVLQTGRQPKRTGADLGSWGETQHWMCSIAIIMQLPLCLHFQRKSL